jgi:deoxyribose-phosphate aldolase
MNVDRPLRPGGNALPPEVRLRLAKEDNPRPSVVPRIDHTLLRADATAEEIDRLCVEADRLGFAAVCVNPTWVPRAALTLRGSRVAVCTVVGFPLGAMTAEAKALESRHAVARGATEVDMVIAIGHLLSGLDDAVAREVAGVRAAVGRAIVLKVILETALLDEPLIVRAATLAVDEGADYVKTSTGFGPGGATEAAVRLLRQTVGDRARVKASGGIRDLAAARRMVEAGADRIGTSSGVAMAEAERAEFTGG